MDISESAATAVDPFQLGTVTATGMFVSIQTLNHRFLDISRCLDMYRCPDV
jgi:hypothetical protein